MTRTTFLVLLAAALSFAGLASFDLPAEAGVSVSGLEFRVLDDIPPAELEMALQSLLDNCLEPFSVAPDIGESPPIHYVIAARTIPDCVVAP